MNGMSLVNTAIVILQVQRCTERLVSSATTALGLIVMFANFLQQYCTSRLSRLRVGECSGGLTGADRIQEMFDAEEEIRHKMHRRFTELREGVEISRDFCMNKPIFKKMLAHFQL